MNACDLIIVGGIGNCRDIFDAVAARAGADAYGPELKVIGFVDDELPRGAEVCGLPVLGPLAAVAHYSEALVVNGIGSRRSYRSKLELIARLGLERRRFATVVHPRAWVASSARIGIGSVVLANCTVSSGVQIGDHALLQPNGFIGHDSKIGDYAICGAGVLLSANVEVGAGAFLGMGAIVRDGGVVKSGEFVAEGAIVDIDPPPPHSSDGGLSLV